jgi:hypothetical protein
MTDGFPSITSTVDQRDQCAKIIVAVTEESHPKNQPRVLPVL